MLIIKYIINFVFFNYNYFKFKICLIKIYNNDFIIDISFSKVLHESTIFVFIIIKFTTVLVNKSLKSVAHSITELAINKPFIICLNCSSKPMRFIWIFADHSFIVINASIDVYILYPSIFIFFIIKINYKILVFAIHFVYLNEIIFF